MPDWTDVEIVLPHAKAIAFDGCHKIYVLMDNEQVAKMTTYGYGDDDGSYLLTADKLSKAEMLDTLEKWFADSCSLKFINAVSSVPEGTDPNEGFSTLIGQFEYDECDDCGEVGCQGVCNDYEDGEDEDENDY
jgi:hypothetical protein